MCAIRLTVPPIYSKILSKFPQKLSFCFAYGSGVKTQIQNVKSSMIDFVFCVENTNKWHEENLKLNSDHYSVLKFLGNNAIAKYQENFGAKVYFNTLVNIDDVLIKYGVISRKDLITDLLEWSDLYLAGRLHKPVEIIRNTTNVELQTALQINLRSAVHATLLLMPETFSEYDFYYSICNLSYGGDFRMIFGENKNKVANIVRPQITSFRNLYKPLINSLHDYVDIPAITLGENANKNNLELLDCKQDTSPLAKLHHLNQLPRWPQKAITRFWNRGTVAQDTEDVLRAVAYDPDCGIIVGDCIKDIVWKSSISQSLKGIFTAGVVKNKMPYPLSDEESSDSDSGVRFKTTNIRDKLKSSSSSSSFNSSEYSNDKYSTKNYRGTSPERSTRREKSFKHNRAYDTDDRERVKEKHSSRGQKRNDSRVIKYLEKRTDRKEDRKSSREDKSKIDRKSEDSRYIKGSEKEKIYKSDNKSHKNIRNISCINKEIDKSNESNEKGTFVLALPASSNSATQIKEKVIKTCELDVYGPTLPTVTILNVSKSSKNPDNNYIVSLPPSSSAGKEKNNEPEIYGPILPNNFSNVLADSDDERNSFGPSLPSNSKKETNVNENSKDYRTIGPSLPQHLIENETKIINNENIVNIITPDSDSDEDMNIIGPLPNKIINTELEERALEIKLNSYNKNSDIKTREEWMLELPEVHTVAQTLGPRTFRTKEMPDMTDRSSWTDINGQKTNKPSTTKIDVNTKYIEEKNTIQEKIVEKHKKNKRCKSLIDMHNEKMQIKKLKEKSNERRPFSRDIDLQVNRFDAEHSKTIIKKAHLLDSRFSSGQSKFL